MQESEIQKPKMQEKFKDHLKKYESDEDYISYINRPLGLFNAYINTYVGPDIKTGLALCHGHNHSIEKFKKIKFINYWYLIDGDAYSFPDYICDLTDIKQLEYFPDDFFDCIMSIYCRVVDTDDNLQYFNILDNVKRILKHDGFFISTELERLFFRFMNDDELIRMNNQLIKLTDEDEIKKYINNFNVKLHFGEDTENITEKQKTFIILNHFEFQKNNTIDIKSIILEKIKLVLKRNGYYFVDLIGEYIFFVPIERVTNKKELLKYTNCD
ncbi:hypothetical protein [Acanthamoeba castellanii mimivirus]|uniref:Uncharacterized protein L16 n=5 Tax=Mimivirus TaxID=315393 RepID=YL016_MIMIV|nr:hypothetical protein MIMI_gp0019 [Acanthamoeba polyphaga mimivirus]Q5UP94.1 RecName: Full=Uncharacterized protein L16 [Acanthamoeba polyphaga mimivirus]AEQ60178.1 hypothetical protein [Acanthamoeba castellanii mamavirus]AHA45876.1 hypothetical protein HIRU_S970 [Hirudovirus strain Sangsue]AHJ39848.1 hypothetical protein [Samba virus]ALR83554.1 hypothetical protein [Niemeyer virus]AMZ02467.1 hypothetical protein [Mimivirus Bombay]EJN41231.1 hypothetical protein lvs_L2 [Acanthamoeba polypha